MEEIWLNIKFDDITMPKFEGCISIMMMSLVRCCQDIYSYISGSIMVDILLCRRCVVLSITCKHIKTHGRVSAAKKAVWCTSVLFTGTANSPFSAPRISITTTSISIKFTYFMPSIYVTLHTKFERKQSSSSRDMCSWKLPCFLHLFLLLRTVLQK